MRAKKLTKHGSELNDMLAYLATDLLRWAYDDSAYYDDPQDGGKLLGHHDRYQRRTSSGAQFMSAHTMRAHLLSGNGMLQIIEAMRDGKNGGWRGYMYVNGDCMAAFQRDDDEYAPDDYITFAQRTGLTLPEAVVRAAYAALQQRVT